MDIGRMQDTQVMLGRGLHLLLSVERGAGKRKKKHPHPHDGAEDACNLSMIHSRAREVT